MVMYMCPVCGKGVSGGENHKCKPKPYPFNVLVDKKEDEEKDNPFFKGYRPDFYFRTSKY